MGLRNFTSGILFLASLLHGGVDCEVVLVLLRKVGIVLVQAILTIGVIGC